MVFLPVDHYEDRCTSYLMLVPRLQVLQKLPELARDLIHRCMVHLASGPFQAEYFSENRLEAVSGREVFVLFGDHFTRARVFLAVTAHCEAELCRRGLSVLGSSSIDLFLALLDRIDRDGRCAELDVHERGIGHCTEQVFQPDLLLVLAIGSTAVELGDERSEVLQTSHFG